MQINPRQLRHGNRMLLTAPSEYLLDNVITRRRRLPVHFDAAVSRRNMAPPATSYQLMVMVSGRDESTYDKR